MEWETLKALLDYILYPVLAVGAWFMRNQIERLEKVEQTQQTTDVRVSVIETKVDDLRDDIKDIKKNVQKLVERK